MNQHARLSISPAGLQLLALAIAVLLFAVGRFGFFDLLGLKRLVELVLLIPIGLIGLGCLCVHPRLWRNPYLWLAASYLFFQLFWLPNLLVSADLCGAMLMIIVVDAYGLLFSDRLLRYLIVIATFFASLGLLEFLLLLWQPTLVKHILLFYDAYSASKVPVINHGMQLLGLSDGTAYHLWGWSVTRLRSFTSEPSLLVGYFLVPGALSLTYGGKYRLFGVICIGFCICSLAGSVFAALFFSAVGLLTFRSKRLFIYLPFCLLIVFIYVLNAHFESLILLAKSSGSDYDFLDKTNSATMRFGYIRDFIPLVFSSPLGLAEDLHQPLGLIVGSQARSGIFGFALINIILYRLFCLLATLARDYRIPNLTRMGLLVIYGALTTGILYLDNCFIQLYGLTLLFLLHNRLTLFLHQLQNRVQ